MNRPESEQRGMTYSGAIFIMALLTALTLLWTGVAEAGAPRYRQNAAGAPVPDTFTIASAACPTGSPGVSADGLTPGISLSGLRGFKVTVCPAAGQTITGVGLLKVCTYAAEPWGPGEWALSPEMTWDMTDVTSTADNPCIEFSQLQPVVALSDWVFVYPSTDFGVSGGTTLTVYLTGETR
jgi:hypothetical protein